MMTIREINRLVEDYIGTTSDGYLNYFSYSKHEAFYHTYGDIEIDVPAYRSRCGSTRKTFIQILKDAAPRDQAKIIRGIFEFVRPPEDPCDDEAKRRRTAYDDLVKVAARLEGDGQVELPVLEITTETVALALRDAEILLKNSGPTNALDRAHTALHGYLKNICIKRGHSPAPDASLTALFKILREQFPEFKDLVAHDNEAKRVFGSIATALDGLNTIRNRGTLAHPNELLLESAEAMLFINLSKAALGYLNTKLK
jgi:hypothetical protein